MTYQRGKQNAHRKDLAARKAQLENPNRRPRWNDQTGKR